MVLKTYCHLFWKFKKKRKKKKKKTENLNFKNAKIKEAKILDFENG